MGAWGCKIDENDTALDVKALYMDELNDLTPEEAFYRVENSSLYSYDDSILMLAELQIEELGKLVGMVKNDIMRVIENQLSDDELSRWFESEERKDEILEFKKKVEKHI